MLWEGCRLEAYLDQKGIWTVGYGATGEGIGPDTIWTKQQAIDNLSNRVNEVGEWVDEMVTVPINANQRSALISLCYNIGVGNFKRSSLLKVLNNEKYQDAADQFLIWDLVGGRPEYGLQRRRSAERTLFRTPV